MPDKCQRGHLVVCVEEVKKVKNFFGGFSRTTPAGKETEETKNRSKKRNNKNSILS